MADGVKVLNMERVRVAVTGFVILFMASAASAQTSSVNGRVVNARGGVVADAEVTLDVLMSAMPGMPMMRNPNAPPPQTMRSGSDGGFAFPVVAPGRYILMVDAPGFGRSSQEITVPTQQPFAIANDETTEFVSDALVNNPVLVLPTNGTGVVGLKDDFIVELRSSDGQLVDVGNVRASASMSMSGVPMLGSVAVQRTDVPGRYRADGEFSMAGTWRVTIEWGGPTGDRSVTFPGAVQ